MCASASAFVSRLCSFPMRTPPVRSYIHIAEPSARATFGLIKPSREKIGMRKGSTRTRCGAVLRRRWRSASAFVDEEVLALLQVPKPAVDELRRLRRRARREVVSLDECGAQPSGRRIERDAGTGDAAADHEHIEVLLAQPRQGPRPVERGERHRWSS